MIETLLHDYLYKSLSKEFDEIKITSMKEFRYIKENGKFVWCHGDEKLHYSDDLWFLVDVTDADVGMCTMLGHGGKKNVNARYDRLHQAYKESNHPEMTDDLLMIDMSGIDLEEINKCINITGYISKFVKAVQDG